MGSNGDIPASPADKPTTAATSDQRIDTPMYRVMLLNDDYTPMEFAASVLETIFGKTSEDALAVLLQTHREGRGACGIFSYDEATAKAAQVADLARQNRHPLACAVEPALPAPDSSSMASVEADPAASLFDPTRHLPLRAADQWDQQAAQETIREIAADALARFDPELFWPAHPLDDGARDGTTSLYFGATGVIWALDALRRGGMIDASQDFAPVLPRLLAANRAEYAKGPYPRHASWLIGELGVLALALRLAPTREAADALHERCSANTELPVLELMWGLPGSMLACVFADALTGGAEPRWRTLYLRQAERLAADLEDDPVYGPLWTQNLYGQRLRYLGPVHGFAGNMLPLLRGWRWLDPSQQARLAAAAPRVLAATAWHAPDGVANWPAVATRTAPPRLVQHCHGAPGMVTTFTDSPLRTAGLDALLHAAGELIWRAGPLAKGPGLCHGTAGNGYAFLKLWRHTGDAVWLDRARAFAAAAIAQYRAAATRHARGRYSLWTGDLGLAMYLRDCLEGEARFPTHDVF